MGAGRNPCFVLAMDSGLRRNDLEGYKYRIEFV
jgi:hypothetical protein